MRIHFIVRTLNEATGGGSHHNALAYIRLLKEHGHTVTVHAFARAGTVAPPDVPVDIHDFGKGSFVQDHTDLAGLLRAHESDADVFFLYGVDFLWGGGLYRVQGGSVPVAVYLDTYLPTMARGSGNSTTTASLVLYRMKRLIWEKTIGRKYLQAVDRYLAVSPYLQEVYVRTAFPLVRMRIVPNAFTHLLHPVPPETRTEVTLLYTGRFIYDKGVDVLLEALGGLTALSWKLRLIGVGPEVSKYESCGKRLGIQDRVTILPWQDATALAQEYARADIFVHPARWPEPFGRTLVEAMSAGLPLIVPETGAAAWVAGKAGRTFPNGNSVRLRATIKSLLEDPSERASLASSAPSEAGRFSASQVVPILEEALRELGPQDAQKPGLG